MSKSKIIATASLVALLILMWWEFLDSRAPTTADGSLPIEAMRAQIAKIPQDRLPERIEVITTGTQKAPRFAVETGAGLGSFPIGFTAFEVDYGKDHVLIDTAVDHSTAMKKAKGDPKGFNPAAYQALSESLRSAKQIILTHEHDDHAMGLLAQPTLPELLKRTYLPTSQRQGLYHLAGASGREALASAHWVTPAVRLVVPGIAVAPAPGHSPGSQLVLVRLKNGQDYLFIGDISWSRSGIDTLKTRPRFLQWIMFDPNEDRQAVLQQLRNLHETIARHKPPTIIVPNHDRDYLDRMIRQGLLFTKKPAESNLPANEK